MKSLRDSGKIIGSPVSIKQVANQCNLQFPLSLSQFIAAPGCPLSSCNRIHIKVLANPNISIDKMLDAMHLVYSTAGIRVEIVTREYLTGPQFATLLDIQVGSCQGGVTTNQQNQLFQNRNNVGNNEIVVYFVRSTIPALNGCAVSPAGQPGAIVSQIGSRWTLAHEVGHVLGLIHVPGENCANPANTRLMTGCGTAKIVGTATLIQSEVNTMKSSNLTQQC